MDLLITADSAHIQSEENKQVYIEIQGVDFDNVFEEIKENVSIVAITEVFLDKRALNQVAEIDIENLLDQIGKEKVKEYFELMEVE